ncbi:uncharacterized mitochondrial protein AtMg00810-like [Benincasa hispida]|uniref:uncharacterized mitochondrial protein AtMg00810-like n=1 Tax=Benincasa hispida TaxID=102211 RepID=UPI001901E119|nr:uncharacterized mitochondrial protein AtMg00810-like [Benincasa hispida]
MKDLGPLSYFLGLKVSSYSDGYYLSQKKYAFDLLTRSGIVDFATSSIPLDQNIHLIPFDGLSLNDSILYRQLIGSLIYLTMTRLGIACAIHIVSQFMAAPRTIHFTIVYCIPHYVKGTLAHGLQFSSQSSLVQSGYSDANWARDPIDKRSTIGYCFYLGDSFISLRSKKQTVVSRSSTDSKYMHLPMLLQSYYGFASSLKIWEFFNSLLLSFTVTIEALSKLLTMMYFMNVPNTLKIIVIVSIIIF